MSHPVIIQGGMGVGVSDWRLARAVSETGQLGVVSGTGMAIVLSRRLQDGDPGGHMRRALSHFPFPQVAERLLERYVIPGGRAAGRSYRSLPMPTLRQNKRLLELTVAANFVEVFLAKEGHDGLIGINLLEKIQLPTLPSLYGAMLAGVDYVLMGAGIPREIPGALDALAEHQATELTLYVEGADPGDSTLIHFDPRSVIPTDLPPLKRPFFLGIIASATLAIALARKSTGRVDGFVIEGPTAGGHNAPPRGAMRYNERGEPLYGPRDEVELSKIRALGLPFWLAGSYAEPEKLQEALAEGATGIQVGTAFAFCQESGLTEEIRRAVLLRALDDGVEVHTDAAASPTGFPFKVIQLEETLADPALYEARPRNCDLGYLRTAYQREDGSIDFRCPAEPVDTYLKKGGALEDTIGRKCLCNALSANIGLAQVQPSGYEERALLTAGDDVRHVARFLAPDATSYSARDVINYLTQA